MAFRETPFSDRLDRYVIYASLLWALFLVALLYGTVTGDEGIGRAWLNFGTVTALVAGGIGVAGWWRQRRLVERLEDVAPGSRGDRSVVEGWIGEASGSVAAPVVDDERVDQRGETGEAADVDVDISIGDAATGPSPDEGAVTRWYEARVVEYVRKVVGRGHKTTTVHEERRGATPFLVETRTETVDLTDADLSFLQGERERFESPTVNVEDGELRLAGWSEAVPGASLDAGSDGGAGSPTAELLGRAVEGGDRLVREEKHRVRGRRWAAADGESVYVVGEFDRAPDGRLRPSGAVTVGRGRFTDRLDEERERLERWTRRGRVGAVLFVGGAGVLATLVGV